MTRIPQSFVRGLFMGLAIAGSATGSFVADAQQIDQAVIQEVIVTAQKRAANLQDVPFSVSATSQDQIRNSSSTGTRGRR